MVSTTLDAGLGVNDRLNPTFKTVSVVDSGTVLFGTSATITGSPAATLGAVTAGAITATSLTTTSVNKGSATNAITALVGGAQAGTALTTSINRVTTVASANDSVQLPVSVAGLRITVINAAASNACAVFGQTGDVVNALSANTAFSLAANKTAEFVCAVAGTWNTILTA